MRLKAIRNNSDGFFICLANMFVVLFSRFYIMFDFTLIFQLFCKSLHVAY